MAKHHHRIGFFVPFEMYDILEGDLLINDNAKVLKSLKKYLTLFCMVPSPDDLEVANIEKSFDMAAHKIILYSIAFPKLSPGMLCSFYDIADREGIKRFFQGLSYD